MWKIGVLYFLWKGYDIFFTPGLSPILKFY